MPPETEVERHRRLTREAALAKETNRRRDAAITARAKAEKARADARNARIADASKREIESRKVAITRRTGGTRGVPLVKVSHHLSPAMAVVALPPQGAKSNDPRVLSYPTLLRELRPRVASSAKFAEAAAVAEPLARETVKAYGAILKMLRDERWWDKIADAAGLTINSDGKAEPWKGAHAEGTQPVKLRNAPTIESVTVAGDGLRISISPRIGDTAKAWNAKTDMIRAAFKSAGTDASDLTIAETSSGGIELRFNDRDPFAHIGNIEQVYDAERGRSLLGLDSSGREVWITWAGNSGMVVGGVPGSGKTASMLGVFAAMAGEAELHVFDGKAGFDLEPLEMIATTYSNEGEVHSPLETLRALDKLRVQRAQAIRQATGGNNFWNVPLDVRRAHGLVPVFLVLDEVQTWTDQSGLSKEEKAISAEIVKLIRTLIQKSRSVGIVTILTTQKPDSVTIPTVIRDNAALKIAFKVSTPEQATTILGTQSADAPSPTTISLATKGRFVMETEGQGIVLGQAGYVSPDALMVSLADAPRAVDQSRVAAQLLGEPAPAAPTPAPAAPAPTAAVPVPTPTAVSAPTPATITAIIPTPEEARAMTPEQRLEAMRLIAQIQGALPVEPATETPAVATETVPVPAQDTRRAAAMEEATRRGLVTDLTTGFDI